MKTNIRVSVVLLIGVSIVGPNAFSADRPDGPPSATGKDQFRRLSAAEAAQLARRIAQTVRERGELESADTREIVCQVRGTTTILRVVPEGSVVKKGDLLVELDSAALRAELLQQQMVVAKAESELRQSETALAVVRQQEKGQLAAAELALQVAELDRKKCLGEGGEIELRLKEADAQIRVNQQKLKVAESLVQRAEDAIRRREAGPEKLEEARLVAVEAQAALEVATASKRLLTEHLRNHLAAQLELAIVEAKTALSQVRHEFDAAVQMAEAEVRARRAALDLEQAKLAGIQQQIENCRILAPRDGLVVYAKTRYDRGIEPGASVRQGQPLLLMPDIKRLRVRVQVHESSIDRIRKGQPVTVRFDAFPDRAFQGTVTEIGNTPEPPGFLFPDEKNYPILVSIENPAPALRLGMTGLAEIDVSGPNDN